MGREGGRIWTLIVFFIFISVSFVQGEILKKTLINPDLQKREIKRKTTYSGNSSGIRTKSSNFPSVGSHKTSAFHCRREKKSDLSIKKVYVKDCYIHVVIKNEGKGKLRNSDWMKGKLILKIKSSRKSGVKIKNYTFSLKQVDPNGYLKKPGRRVDFNTGILCKKSMWVRVRLKNLKRDGNRGCKQLSLTLSPSGACAGSEAKITHEEMDPCSEVLNPRCEPRSCRTADGRAGRCSMVGGSCICMAEVVADPCSSEVNPSCNPTTCRTSDGRAGRCSLSDGRCICVVEEMDPCSEVLNPRCEPTSCRTADGRAGRCSMVGGSCICMAEE